MKIKVQNIVEKATALKNKRVDDKNTPVNYACIFSQSKEEYDDLIDVTRKIGNVIEEMPTGLLFQISPFVPLVRLASSPHNTGYTALR